MSQTIIEYIWYFMNGITCAASSFHGILAVSRGEMTMQPNSIYFTLMGVGILFALGFVVIVTVEAVLEWLSLRNARNRAENSGNWLDKDDRGE